MVTPLPGDLVQVTWVDIYENPVGNPAEAELAKRISVGYFWGTKDSQGVPALVTTTTIDEGDTDVSGWCIYPVSCVIDLKIVKRGKREKKAKNVDRDRIHRTRKANPASPVSGGDHLPVPNAPVGAEGTSDRERRS